MCWIIGSSSRARGSVTLTCRPSRRIGSRWPTCGAQAAPAAVDDPRAPRRSCPARRTHAEAAASMRGHLGVRAISAPALAARARVDGAISGFTWPSAGSTSRRSRARRGRARRSAARRPSSTCVSRPAGGLERLLVAQQPELLVGLGDHQPAGDVEVERRELASSSFHSPQASSREPRLLLQPLAPRRCASIPPMSWWIAICRWNRPALVPDASRLSSPRSSSTTSTPRARGSRRARPAIPPPMTRRRSRRAAGSRDGHAAGRRLTGSGPRSSVGLASRSRRAATGRAGSRGVASTSDRRRGRAIARDLALAVAALAQPHAGAGERLDDADVGGGAAASSTSRA